MKRELRRRPAITKRHSMVSFNDTFYKRHRQQHAQDTEQLRDHSNDGVNRLNQLDYNWQSKQKQLFAGTVNTKDGNGGTLVSNNDQKFSDSGVSSSYNNGVKGSHTSRDSPGKRGGKENQRLGTDNEGNMSATSSNTYSDGDESSSSQAQSLYHTQQEQRKSSTIQMQRPELMRMKTYNPVMREISTPASSSQAAGSEPNTSLQTNVDTNTTDEGGETSAVVSRDHGAGDLDFDCSAQSQSMNEGEWRSKSDGDGDSSASESEGNSNNESDHAGDRRKRYTIARRGRLSSSQSSSSSTSSKSNSLQKTPASKFRKSYHRSHPQHRNKNISDHVANKSDVDRSSNDIASGGTEKEEVPTSTTHTDKHTFDDASDVGRATTEMVTKASNQTIKTKTNDKTDSKKSRTAKASGVLLSPGRSKARLSRSLSSNKGKKAGLSRRKRPISTNTKKGRGTNNSDSMSGRSSKVDVAKPRKTLSLMSDIRQMRQSRAQFDIDHFQKHQQMEKEKATKERKERMRKEEEEKKKWEGSKRRTWSFAKFNSVLNDGLVELQEIQAQEKDMERDLAHDYDFDYSDDADEVVIGRRGSSLNAVTEQNQGRKSGKSHKPRRTGRSKRKKVLDEEDDGFYEIPSFDLDTDDANSSEALRHGTDNKAGRGYQQMSGGGSGWSSGSETDEDFQIDEEDNGYSGNFFRPSNDVVQTRRTGIKRKPKTPKKTAPNTDMNLRARQSLSTSTTASSSLSSVRRKLPTTDVSGAAKKSRSKIEKSK